MLITEKRLQAAVEKFLGEARIPVPPGWNHEKDVLYIQNVLVPAFYAALHEIEDVDPCYGFDLKNIKVNLSNVKPGRPIPNLNSPPREDPC